jgi:glutamyl-tRNA reductase
MSPALLGVSLARHAPVALRERVPVGPGPRRELLDTLAAVAPERFLLHTCERLELYLAADRPEADAVFPAVARWLRVAPDALAAHVRVVRGDEAARHLFRVASGLQSRLLGEPQIRGQVREAFREARAAGALGPHVDALCRAALHAARLVHRNTTLGRGTCLAELALGRLGAELGTLRGRSVVVAGTGRLGAQVVGALAAAHARVTVASRSVERAEAMGRRFSAGAVGPGDLDRALATADALVTCTHGVLPIVAVRASLVVLDLGMPPNVPRRVTGDGLRLARLEDLTAGAVGSEVVKAARIVDQEVERFGLWRAQRVADEDASIAKPAA